MQMYLWTIVMEICIENDHYIYVFILQFFVYQFHIKIKKVFTQGFNSIFEFINIIYAFKSFALIFGSFFDCYFCTPPRILWKEVWVILFFLTTWSLWSVVKQELKKIFLKNVHRWAYLAFKQNKSLLARYSTLGSWEVITNVIQQRYK